MQFTAIPYQWATKINLQIRYLAQSAPKLSHLTPYRAHYTRSKLLRDDLNCSPMAAMQMLTHLVGYAAAKACDRNFIRRLAVHMAQTYSRRIQVNALAPGLFISKQNRALLLNDDDGLTPQGQSIVKPTPMGGLGDPEGLLGTVLWLLSPEATFITGGVVPVCDSFSALSGV